MKKNLCVLLLLSVSIMGCDDLFSFQKKVKKSDDLQFFEVASTPVAPEEQMPDKIYLADFEVERELLLTPEQTDSVRAALMEKSNFSKEHTKRCPFMGKYAVRVDTGLVCIISTSPCAKMTVVFGESGKTNSLDMVSDNDLEQTFRQASAN